MSLNTAIPYHINLFNVQKNPVHQQQRITFSHFALACAFWKHFRSNVWWQKLALSQIWRKLATSKVAMVWGILLVQSATSNKRHIPTTYCVALPLKSYQSQSGGEKPSVSIPQRWWNIKSDETAAADAFTAASTLIELASVRLTLHLPLLQQQLIQDLLVRQLWDQLKTFASWVCKNGRAPFYPRNPAPHWG